MAKSQSTDVGNSVPMEIAEIAREANADYVNRGGSIPDQYYMGFQDLAQANSVSGRETHPINIVQVIPRTTGVTIVVTESEEWE